MNKGRWWRSRRGGVGFEGSQGKEGNRAAVNFQGFVGLRRTELFLRHSCRDGSASDIIVVVGMTEGRESWLYEAIQEIMANRVDDVRIRLTGIREFSPCRQTLLNTSVIAQARSSLTSGAGESASNAKVLPTDDNGCPVAKAGVCVTLELDWIEIRDAM